jgi:hypothetical protein
MDWVSFTCTSACHIVLASFRGEPLAALLEKHNRDYARSYDRWFHALYQDKYEYIGDFELMRLAFLLDLGFYYIGVANQPYQRGSRALCEPLFSTGPSVPVFYLMRAYNRRFAQIARARRARNVFGRQNNSRRFMFKGFTFSSTSAMPIATAIVHWLFLELKEGWRSWFSSKSSPREDVKLSATPSYARTSRG